MEFPLMDHMDRGEEGVGMGAGAGVAGLDLGHAIFGDEIPTPGELGRTNNLDEHIMDHQQHLHSSMTADDSAAVAGAGAGLGIGLGGMLPGVGPGGVGMPPGADMGAPGYHPYSFDFALLEDFSNEEKEHLGLGISCKAGSAAAELRRRKRPPRR